jgi:hypothetical protein
MQYFNQETQKIAKCTSKRAYSVHNAVVILDF